MTAKIADFGLARLRDGSQQQSAADGGEIIVFLSVVSSALCVIL